MWENLEGTTCKSGSRWDDNIKIDVKETGCELDCSGSGQRQVASFGECGNVPSDSIKREFPD